MIYCTNPNCLGGSISYKSPTEDDKEIIIRCNGCGKEWPEPNQKYIQKRKRDLEEDYFNSFDR